MPVIPSKSEFEAAARWCSGSFGLPLAVGGELRPPFSFRCAGKSSSALLPCWRADRSEGPSEPHAELSLLRWVDPDSGLECRCEVTRFTDFPAVEWVVYFKNTGRFDTPILADIQALDGALGLPREKNARLHTARGSECRLDDFAPHATWLGPNKYDPQGEWIGESNPLRLASKGGRSSCGALPFFNLEMDARGVIGAIGWTGDWAATFYRSDTKVRMRAGMQRTHLKLLPGEEIRTPRILLLFWEGERLRGHNLLRQFILAYHTPRINGKGAEVPICNATWGGNFAEKHIAHGKWWKDHELPLDYLWIDAGWYGDDEAKSGATVFNSKWGANVGNWYPNPGYFPDGFNPVGKALKEMGLGFLLWLEPERVKKDTHWARECPEWLLGPLNGAYLLNLGIPEARHMVTDHLSSLIREGHIGCYRQDFNMDPKPFWEAADAPDRVGISEIRHITGLYAMWDELLQRHPELLIDNCSSGGRRIDLETISRSIPLWRSDIQCWPGFGATAMQAQTHGLGLWVPLSSGCCDREDPYVFRSALGPGMVLIMYEFENNLEKHFSVDWLRKMLEELATVRKFFLGDFYPLLSFALSDDAWAAWQFDRSDLGQGMVLAFRRPSSPFTAMTAKLHGLERAADYEIQAEGAGLQRRLGLELCESGLTIEIGEQPGSRLYLYRKLPATA